MSDQSSFEEVGLSLSDVDSTIEGDKDEEKTILFEFPSSFPSNDKQDHVRKDQSHENESKNKSDLQSNCSSYVPVARLTNLKIRTETHSPKNDQQRTTGCVTKFENTTEPDAQSETSSFVPVNRLSNLNIEKDDVKPASLLFRRSIVNDEDVAETNSLWSTIERKSDCTGFESEVSWRTGTFEECSVAASSTISGFDLISLGDTGEIKRRCQRCTLVNENEDGVCQCCGLALIANPNIDMDAQIAIHLHLQEEQNAFNLLKNKEKRRKMLSQEPLIEQSRLFAKDIIECIRSNQLVGGDKLVGFCSLPEPSLSILASSFIDYVKINHTNIFLRLGVCFTSKLQKDIDSVRKNGFENGIKVFFTVKKYQKAFSKFPLHPLPTIQEDETITDAEKLGWFTLVAEDIVDKQSRNPDRLMKDEEIMSRGDQILPLVCFDASLYEHDSMKDIKKVLIRVVSDFFHEDLNLSLLFVDLKFLESNRSNLPRATQVQQNTGICNNVSQPVLPTSSNVEKIDDTNELMSSLEIIEPKEDSVVTYENMWDHANELSSSRETIDEPQDVIALSQDNSAKGYEDIWDYEKTEDL